MKYFPLSEHPTEFDSIFSYFFVAFVLLRIHSLAFFLQGSSIIRMLDHYLGVQKFREGLKVCNLKLSPSFPVPGLPFFYSLPSFLALSPSLRHSSSYYIFIPSFLLLFILSSPELILSILLQSLVYSFFYLILFSIWLYISGSLFGFYPTFHTLKSIGRNKLFSMLKECSRFSSYSDFLYFLPHSLLPDVFFLIYLNPDIILSYVKKQLSLITRPSCSLFSDWLADLIQTENQVLSLLF